MNRPEPNSSEPPPEPDSPGRSSGLAPEGWLDRLRAAVGLRGSSTIREEIVDALATGSGDGGFSPDERAMLSNILSLREVRVDDIMVPRADIDAVEIGTSLGGLLMAFQKSGHSRMPVHRETLDDPVGLVHIKDLMSHMTRLAAIGGDSEEGGSEGFDLRRVDLTRPLAKADLVRNILFVPPSMPVTGLLASMQATRMQLALVIDEYGGTDGLVSLEDVIEMVVGDIEDEHDDDEVPMIVPEGESGFLADARADLDDVSAAVGTDLSGGEAGEDIDTIGGLVVSLLGRVPVRGELVSAPGGFEFEILDADPRRIKRLRIRRKPSAPRQEPRRKPRPADARPDNEAA
jgi:CBS domain containing-hemolysin-like protein